MINLYRNWVQLMCPGINYFDALEDIEKLGKTKRMKSFMAGLRKGGRDEIAEKEVSDEGIDFVEFDFKDEIKRKEKKKEENSLEKGKNQKLKKIEDFEFKKENDDVSFVGLNSVIGLTDEQKERIRLNKLRALALKDKHKKMKTNSKM